LKPAIGIILLITGLLIGGIAGYVGGTKFGGGTSPSVVGTASRSTNVTVISGVIEDPTQSRPGAYSFAVPLGANNAILTGTFTGGYCGGGGCINGGVFSPEALVTVEALVFSSSDYAKWQSGSGASPLYNSTWVEGGAINLHVPPGMYYLVISTGGALGQIGDVRIEASLAY